MSRVFKYKLFKVLFFFLTGSPGNLIFQFYLPIVEKAAPEPSLSNSLLNRFTTSMTNADTQAPGIVLSGSYAFTIITGPKDRYLEISVLFSWLRK